MDFIKRKGLAIILYLFAGLLVLNGILTTYQAMGSDTIPGSFNGITGLQIGLVVLGVPLLMTLASRLGKSKQKLLSMSQEIEENNRRYVFNSLDQVDHTNDVEVQSRLLNNLKKASEFIKAVSNGNYDIQWEGMTDSNREANAENIAGELLQMRDQMKAVKEQDQIRLWTTEGLSRFGEIIRANQSNFDKLAENLISNVVKYTHAKMGGLFILEGGENGETPHLSLKACYAYDRKKYLTKIVALGEGLVGQSYIEGHTIFLTKVPNDFVSITSGLGEANPKSVLIVPLKANEKIEGVLELASLTVFKPHEIQFLEKLGETLASSIVAVRSNEKTASLLQTSQEQSEQMRAQEEEMRQNMEELEATQEQMNRSVSELAGIKESLEKEKYLLDALMDNLPDAIYFKDHQSKFLRVSKYLADHFNSSVDGLIGKSDFDFQDVAHAQEAFDDERNIMETRKAKIDYVEREVSSDGVEHWVSTTKMPLVDHHGRVVGTFGVSRDISKIKKLEKDYLEKEQKMNKIEQEFAEKMKQLEGVIKSKEAEIERLKKAAS